MKKRAIILYVLYRMIQSAGFAIAEGTVTTPPAPLEGLRDVKAPVYFPSNYIVALIFLLVLGITAGIIWYYFFKIKKSKLPDVPVDTRLPWEIAYEQLNELKKNALLEQGQFKLYYSKLSDVVRQYFENQFGVKAPEMTTEEFLWSLEKSNDLKDNYKSSLKKFLSSCDIVKFAKHIPQMNEGIESFQLAKALIDETKTVPGQNSTKTQHKP